MQDGLPRVDQTNRDTGEQQSHDAAKQRIVAIDAAKQQRLGTQPMRELLISRISWRTDCFSMDAR